MKFVVEQIGSKGGRIGKISGLRSQPETAHETPLCIVATLGGSAPHLTQDTFHRVVAKEAPICVPAQHFYDLVKTLQAFKKGVAHFAALKSHSVCVSVQDPSRTTPSGYNEKKGVSVWTYGGRKLLTSERYMGLIEAMQPDWFESLNDADTDGDSSNKRIAKSLLLSTTMLDQCIDAHKTSEPLQKASLFAPLLGGHSEYDRTRWSKTMAERLGSNENIGGFSILGIHTNGPTAENVEPDLASSLSKSSLSSLPSDLPRQSSGAWNPLTVISLAQVGIDIFDSSYPFLVTERRGALIFPNSPDSKIQIQKPSNSLLDHQYKKFKSDGKAASKPGTKKDGEESKDDKATKDDKENCSTGASKLGIKNDADGRTAEGEKKDDKENRPSDEASVSSPFEMCVKDESNFGVMEPLLEGCECYTCKNFTRSYVHHLINVNEMLAPVLLMMHNLHHWNTFFASIREAIKADKLDDLKVLIEASVADA